MSEDHETNNPNAGSFILEQLRESGSNLDEKHEVTFWIYFPSKLQADEAARRADEAGLHPEVSESTSDDAEQKWLCLLHCAHIPDESILDGIDAFCTQLAEDFNGKFDGWEARLELEEGAVPPQLTAESLKLDSKTS